MGKDNKNHNFVDFERSLDSYPNTMGRDDINHVDEERNLESFGDNYTHDLKVDDADRWTLETHELETDVFSIMFVSPIIRSASVFDNLFFNPNGYINIISGQLAP